MEAVSAARGIAPERLNLLADELAPCRCPTMRSATDSSTASSTRTSWPGCWSASGPIPRRVCRSANTPRAWGPDASNVLAPQVAVVYADGAVVDGEGVTGGYIYGNTLAGPSLRCATTTA